MAVPSPGNSQEHFPLSQVLSLSSSQMEELEMSSGYDIDNELLNFSENGQRDKSEREIMNAGLQGHDSDRMSREKTHDLPESEITTSDYGVAIQGSRSLCEKSIVSEKDTHCSERGGQATSSSRKRPYPDS